MAKKKRRAKARGKTRKYKRASTARRRKVKRGCGKHNWRRGPDASWKCKRGKRHYYKRAK